ncbi:hypothetical protein J7337_003560 [Fusarium musae]|uniref:Uncharacterized protein n=1 Tax=Fusarium musae TaxID=1042133 RepID=A0A9P8DKL3_9HYPO|nr:hypothetical protein J7337_003560 [Fusarium musae]KAG9503609.1 hypothetical protein J7337_003560 [Fusarium musae]
MFGPEDAVNKRIEDLGDPNTVRTNSQMERENKKQAVKSPPVASVDKVEEPLRNDIFGLSFFFHQTNSDPSFLSPGDRSSYIHWLCYMGAENVDWIVDGCREVTSTFEPPDEIEGQEQEELEQAEIDVPFSDAAAPGRGLKRKARDDARGEGTIEKQVINRLGNGWKDWRQRHMEMMEFWYRVFLCE